MELLKRRILSDGRALSQNVLLVDSFLNHQVDPKLMREIGKEFGRLFSDKHVTKIVTIESSGISPALMTAEVMNVPMVIMKKQVSAILSDGVVQTEVFSFTKNSKYLLTVKAQFINPGDRVLVIDDFLANGEAAYGAIRLVNQCGGTVVGVGTVIAKAFQNGLSKLREGGFHVEALASIKELSENNIKFED